MTARDDLLEAWEQWDRHPADPRTSRRMVQAVDAAAAGLGVPAPQLRERMAAGRRP